MTPIPDPVGHVQPRVVERRGVDWRLETQRWIEKNAQPWEKFQSLALELARRKRKFSVSLLTERIRWDYKYDYDADFKIANGLRAYIARALVAKYPELKQFLTFRETNY